MIHVKCQVLFSAKKKKKKKKERKKRKTLKKKYEGRLIKFVL